MSISAGYAAMREAQFCDGKHRGVPGFEKVGTYDPNGGKHLAWYEPNAKPRFEGCPHHCRDSECRNTNWGGSDRVHMRNSDCTFVSKFTPCPKCKGEE